MGDAIREVMDKLEEMMVRPVKDIDVIESEIGSLVGRRLNVDGMSSINAKINADLDSEIGRHRMVEQDHSVRKMRIQSKADREIGNVRAEIATLTAAQAQHENEMYELEMRRARRLEEEASYQQRVTAMEEILRLRRLLWVKKTQKPVSKPTESTTVRSFSVGD